MPTVIERLARLRLVPVVVIDRAEGAWPLAQALKAGGLPCAEVTFRTAAAEAAIREIARDPDILLGAGTVLKPDQVDRALDAGATYIVTPGFDPKVVQRCQQRSVPVFPGVATATEISMALDAGIEVVKFFPAEALGGVPTLKAMSAPFSMVRFIPTGGIGPEKLLDYLAVKTVLAVGGSWMVAAKLLEAGNLAEVTRLAGEATARVREKS
ncbi:MAG TPA: bifunctional 4-hydroxy-2-oxoglutarate aldolase/2-dehydro-3-deoxy-phosphogluconate aldolase [Vicinamibacteria bacterium]|jgi:2-dehydro-3-deoxyphosphogluconate aldolase/(4S)-4-hydroxy-2-oxoglutarate aldolase|nr:bifunctional 4-hydroxy-2-oxoglutarate aldolase/2-dehydro-3-deoxy-phosphogluconate aldolase [Vicinamibacteria bacterium]